MYSYINATGSGTNTRIQSYVYADEIIINIHSANMAGRSFLLITPLRETKTQQKILMLERLRSPNVTVYVNYMTQ